MSEIEVRIIKLEPMRVACTYGFGEQPELQAWSKMLAWAKSALQDHSGRRVAELVGCLENIIEIGEEEKDD